MPGHPVLPMACAVLAVALCSASGSSSAEPTVPDGAGLRVSGFGTLGLVHANAPDGWGLRRDISQPGHGGGTRADVDSRLGLQLNYAPSAQFELVGQFIAARRSSYGQLSDGIEWAFAAYRPNSEFTLRLGRLNMDQFLVSDYRNVGFAYMSVRPSVEFYATLPGSFDGADVSRTWQSGGARLRAKLFAGRTHTGDLDANARIEVKPTVGVMLSREAGGLTLRAGLTRSVVVDDGASLKPLLDGLAGLATLPVPAVAAEAQALRARVLSTGEPVIFAALGAQYDASAWQAAVEFNRTSGPPGAQFRAGYASIGRRFGAWLLYTGVSAITSPDSAVDTPAWAAQLEPVLGPALAQQVQLLGHSAAYAVGKSKANQRAFSLGTRWDLHPQVALKLQWDRVRIEANGGRLWSRSTLAAGRADVISAAMDFVF